MKVLASALLLLVLLGALVGSAYSQLPPSAKMRFPDRAVVSGLNQGGDNWQPMRVKAFYDQSIERLSAKQQRLIKCVLVSSAVDWLQKVLLVRQVNMPISFERSCHSFFHYLVNGQSYCPDACAQQTKCGSFSNIPEQHLTGCRMCSTSGECKKKPNTQLQGVQDADFVLYVSVWDDLQCRGLASGGHCQQEEDYGRPIAGYLNVCKYNLKELAIGKENLDIAIRRVLHQLIHALVFSPQLYAFYRDSAGNPLGSTHSDPVVQMDGSFLVSDKVLLKRPAFDWLSRVRVAHSQTYLVTPAVKQIVREHFNCSSLPGAELEDNRGSEIIHRHWEERLFADDMLSASQPGDRNALPSVLTLALFEDSGWYKVDYNYSVPLKWGRGKGCAFVNDSCLGWIKYAKSRGLDTAPFCTEADLKSNRMSCTTDRKALAKCNLINYPVQLPWIYQYFNTTAGGATPYADFCPIFELSMTCEGRANSARFNFALETFGVNTHCIEQKSPWRIQTVSGKSLQSTSWGAGCYNVRCGWWRGKEVTYISLGTQTSNAKEYLCKTKGQTLTIRHKSGSKQYIGTIICPDFYEVCQNLKCLNHCSQKGTCKNGKCFCYPGYFGEDCSQYYGNRLRDCSHDKCLNGQPCVQEDCGFQCDCSADYTGDFCEKLKTAPPPCENENCSGHGECYYGLDGVSPICGCYPGYTGEKCEERIDYCSELKFNPCKNGGTCQNGLESYLCSCPRFYLGDHCEVYKSPCHINRCKNSGKCLEDVHSPLGFQCQCSSQWKGELCEAFRVCSLVICANGSTCLEPTNPWEWKCLCPPGYHGRNCSREDPCNSAPCLNGGLCSSQENGTIHCKCKEGFTGLLCDQEIGPCVPTPCLNGGNCTESGPDSFECNCTSDFVGKHCEIPNPCKDSPCRNGGTCVAQQNGSFYCVCQPGWISQICNISDPCHHNPCYNGGNCTIELYTNFSKLQEAPARQDRRDSYRPHCKCTEGYHGTLCQHKTPCIPNPCENGGRCVNLSLWEPTCRCLSGYIGRNCSIEDSCASKPCLNNATCIPYLNGSFACSCLEGFTSQRCEQKLPCTPNPCHNGGTCREVLFGQQRSNETLPVDFVCDCPPGQTGSVCSEIDLCSPNPCLNGGSCMMANGSFFCKCQAGYSGSTCTEFNPCSMVMCDNGGTCVNLSNGTVQCKCLEGYTSARCELRDPCSPNPCLNGGMCVGTPYPAMENGNVTCLCPQHFTGQWCESEEDPCSPNPCGEGMCTVSELGTINCSCPVHLTGPRCNETVSYIPNICEADPSVCKNNGLCKSTDEHPYYMCTCMSGFTGDHCQDHTICQERPCFNGGNCTVFTKTWRVCICKPGYEGDSCNVSKCPGGNCTEQVEVNNVEFSGSRSFLKFIPVPSPSINELNVTISFRSLYSAGSLLHIKDTTTSRTISLFLYRDRLQLRIMGEDKKLVFASTTRQRLSNKWLIANLFLSSSKVRVSISGNASMRVKTLPPGMLSSFNYTYFSLGGLHMGTFNGARKLQEARDISGFSGCISHVIVQDQLQDLSQALPSSAGVRRGQLDPCGGRCQAGEVCSVVCSLQCRRMEYICQVISDP